MYKKKVDVLVTLLVPVEASPPEDDDEAVDKVMKYLEKGLGQNKEGIEVMDTNIEWVE